MWCLQYRFEKSVPARHRPDPKRRDHSPERVSRLGNRAICPRIAQSKADAKNGYEDSATDNQMRHPPENASFPIDKEQWEHNEREKRRFITQKRQCRYWIREYPKPG